MYLVHSLCRGTTECRSILAADPVSRPTSTYITLKLTQKQDMADSMLSSVPTTASCPKVWSTNTMRQPQEASLNPLAQQPVTGFLLTQLAHEAESMVRYLHVSSIFTTDKLSSDSTLSIHRPHGALRSGPGRICESSAGVVAVCPFVLGTSEIEAATMEQYHSPERPWTHSCAVHHRLQSDIRQWTEEYLVARESSPRT